MRPNADDLLAALVGLQWRGKVTLGEAAKLVGIRKSEMGDLVAWWLVEAAIWRTYVAAFHRAVPECDTRLRRLPPADLKADDLWRDVSGDCTHHDANAIGLLPPSQPGIFAPPSNAARDFAEPESCDAWENSGGFEDRPPGHSTRALRRDTAQHPLDLVPLDTSGPEFEFKAA
jgi:hypothetical protein